MPPRLRYPELAPDGYAALQAFGHYVNTATALDAVLLGLVYLRASTLNGCSFCIAAHRAELRKLHEPESRIEAVADPHASDAFTLREQAALRWTDVLTRLGEGAVSDEDYAAVEQFFSGKDLVDLSFAVANINAWNRMGVAFRPQWHPRAPQAEASVVPAGGAAAATEVSAVADDGAKVAQD